MRKSKFDGRKVCNEKNFRGEIYAAEKFIGSKVHDEENLDDKKYAVRKIRWVKSSSSEKFAW